MEIDLNIPLCDGGEEEHHDAAGEEEQHNAAMDDMDEDLQFVQHYDINMNQGWYSHI